MGFLTALRRVRSELSDEALKWRRLRLQDGAAWSAFFGTDSYSGKSVTVDSALSLATVWACVRLTAQALSVLPIQIYRKDANGGRVVDDDHPLAELLGVAPNVDQTSLEYWESVAGRLSLNGDAISEISRGFRDRVTALTILPGARPVRLPDDTLVYRFVDRGKSEDLPREKVFHVKGFNFGGDSGLSAIRYGVQTFGTALATDESAGKLFSNGMQANGVLTSDANLKKDQREQLKKIMQDYAGSTNAGKLMILEAGLKYQALTLNPEDAQMLDTRRFAVEEICRWFGVPPVIVGHAADGQTMWGSGVEQILIAWLALGINPLAERIERRITMQLVAPGERRRVYAEFNREALLQMDSKAKAEFLSKMVQNGLMNRNEGRAKLNLPRDASPVADQLTAQTALAPLDMLGKIAATRGQSTNIDGGERDEA